MNLEELKAAVLALDPENKKAFILDALPELARDALQDRMFLMRLFPVLLTMLEESGIELRQLLKLVNLLGPAAEAD
jgi:hypothetical protein